MSIKAIKAILDSAPELKSLTEQSRYLLHIQQLVRKMLPTGIASQVSVGYFNSGTLTLTSSSGAAAAKLRQLKPRLLEQLRRTEPEVNSIKIIVQVGTNPNPLPTKRIFLGPEARDALLALSVRLDSPTLRSAVVQLASRGATLNSKQETLEDIDSYKNQSDDDADR
ncbi:MAG: DUF721 domain-containing protein [Betaproteobacteria bacterium]|jgi:hypothetical protein|nr:MAG: DUF721 domain-containing protein [Betaproteobacteria bacterium]